MKTLTLLAALAALSAFGGTDASESFAAKRARNALLAERFAPSCATMRIYFKRDADGEMPTCTVRYFCPNCKDYHTDDVSDYMNEDRPMEGSAFALAPNLFLVQDLHLLADWVERTEIVFGGKAYAAKTVARYPDEEAVEIETAEPVLGVKPLAFSKRIDFMADGDGVFFFSTKEKGLAVCGTHANSTAGFVRYGDIGKDVISAVANTIAVNASNEAVSVSFRSKLAVGEKSFLPPAEWKREPAQAFEERWEAVKRKTSECLVPLYIHLDDEENRKDGYSRRYGSYREDSESTDIDLVGLLLPEGEVLARLDLDASKMSEIDKIEAILADGKRVPLEFVGALSEVKFAVFRFADGKTPEGFRAVTLDTRRPESRFLEPAFVVKANNYNGKIKTKLAYSQVERFTVGRGGETLPALPGFEYSDGGQSLLVYLDGTVGGLAALLRQVERYSGGRTLMMAAKLGAYLAERDFDPQFALRKGKDRVRIAWIGVETQRMTEELAREKKAMALLASAQTSGALVTRVWAGSPATKAGLAVGDILLNARLAKSHRTRDLEDSGSGDEFDWGAFFSMSIGGEDEDYGGYYDGVSPWPNVERGVNRTFTSFGIGKKVVVSYVRDGARKEVELTLEQAPVHYQTAKRIKNKDLGIIVSDMTFEVRGYFKFSEDAPGVVIVKVQPGNPAAIGGLRPLEIITHVNNEPVTGAKDFARKVKGKKDLTFAVRRLAATRVVRIDLKQP